MFFCRCCCLLSLLLSYGIFRAVKISRIKLTDRQTNSPHVCDCAFTKRSTSLFIKHSQLHSNKGDIRRLRSLWVGNTFAQTRAITTPARSVYFHSNCFLDRLLPIWFLPPWHKWLTNRYKKCDINSIYCTIMSKGISGIHLTYNNCLSLLNVITVITLQISILDKITLSCYATLIALSP